MKDIELIKCLIKEIEDEITYQEEYEYRRKIAEKIACKERSKDGRYHCFEEFMPSGLERTPKKAHVKRCAMLVRELCLKLYKRK